MTSPLLPHLHTEPTRLAFDVDGDVLSRRVLEARSRAWAAGLTRLGVRPGDRIAYFGPSSVDLVTALVASLRLGTIHVPINTRYRDEEIRHILQDSGAAAAIVQAGSEGHTTAAALARAPGSRLRLIVLGGEGGEGEHTISDLLADRDADAPEGPKPDDIALLIYTSGTTGRSKGVALSHEALANNIGATTGLWRWTDADRLALALPLFHCHGLGLGLIGSLLRGLSAVITDRFSPEWVVDAVHRQGATIFMGVPTMYARLLTHMQAHPHDATRLARARLFTSGSAALPAADLQAFHAATGHTILERYGMTETGFTLSNPYEGERRPGTVGLPVPGTMVRVVDEAGEPCPQGQPGEIQVKGPGLLTAYWQKAHATRQAFAEGGWFRTGDVATVDADGYHHIVGRMSVDIIKSGGFKLGAREIEDVLTRHPLVAEAAVVGVPDAEWGEAVAAAIVLAEGAPEPDPELQDALTTWVRDHLADYKKPRAWLFLDALPRNALGKVQKHHLKPRFAEASPDP